MRQLTPTQERELQGALADIHAVLGTGWSGAIMLRNGTTLRFIVDAGTPVAEIIAGTFGQPQELKPAQRKA